MTVPAAGEFRVVATYDGHLYIECPNCRTQQAYRTRPVPPSIRDLIAAASEHARSVHPVSVPTANVSV